MAMLMKYHKYPVMNMSFNGASSYTNYNTMERNFYNNSCTTNPASNRLQVAMLIRSCGSFANSGYGVLGTCNTYTLPWNVDDALKNMGYSSGGDWGTLSNKYATLKEDLKNGFPVILTGTLNMVNLNNWHIWVADGYRSYKYEYPSTDFRTNTTRCLPGNTEWIGMNWGWEGKCNGYFYTDYSFDTNENGEGSYGTYDTYLNALTGIRK